MTTRSWIRRLFARTPRTARKAPARYRPRLEALEERTLLASYVAMNAADLITDIRLTNAAGGFNSIELKAAPSAPYTLTAVNNTTDGANGLPVIAPGNRLDIFATIWGAGVTIQRSTAPGTPAFRLFDVAAGASLELSGLTLQNGLAAGAGVSAEGGAIYSRGNLRLPRVTVQNNTAQGVNGINGIDNPISEDGLPGGDARGGGLYVAGGTASLFNDTISGNSAQGGAGGEGEENRIVHFGWAAGGRGGDGGSGYGGGFYVADGIVILGNDGTTNTDTINGNSAQGGHGGDGTRNVNYGSNNDGGDGGGGYGGGFYVAGGAVTLSNQTLRGNRAQGGGGGDLGGNDAFRNFPGGHAGNGGSGVGGGLDVTGGSVALNNDTLSGNSAQGGYGGSGGDGLNADSERFGALGWGGNGGAGAGGGLEVAGGTVRSSDDTLSGNKAQGGTGGGAGYYVGDYGLAASGGDGGGGSGGGLDVTGGTVLSSNDTLSSNSAQGGTGGTGGLGSALFTFWGLGGAGGQGSGGGLHVSQGTVTLSNDTLSGNSAQAGSGGAGTLPLVFFPGFVLPKHGSGGNGGNGGGAQGGGLDVAGGTVNLSSDTLSGNSAQGGNGGDGGYTWSSNGMEPSFPKDYNAGGKGGNGGGGVGGGLDVTGGTVTLTNDTLSGNSAQGGTGGKGGFSEGDVGNTKTQTRGAGGGGGGGVGGGLGVAGGAVTLTNDTFSGNSAKAGSGGDAGILTKSLSDILSSGGPLSAYLSGGTGGAGGGAGNTAGGGLDGAGGSLTLGNTLIAQNTLTAGTAGAGGAGSGGAGSFPGASGSSGNSSGPDVSGPVTSSGPNLIGDGTGSNLMNGVNGNQVGTSTGVIDPKLGPLQNNGGPTLTMALLLNSPARNTGSNALIPAGVTTDQRGSGYARVFGGTVDIGAFEAQDDPPTIARARDLTVKEGTTAVNFGDFYDPQGRDTVTVTASLGTVTQDNRLGGWVWRYTPDDGPSGPTPVTITATDDYGLTATTTFLLTVDNVPPTPTITGVPASGHSPEGTAITLGSSVTDPSPVDTAAGFTYHWSVTRNGVAVISGSGADLPPFAPDDNGTYVVILTATDEDGGVGGVGRYLIVDNVAPTAAITGAPASGHGPEGTAITLGSSVTDPSSADTAAGFTYAWSVTKNGLAYASGTAADFSFTPDDNGTYVVSLTATDKDGGASPAAQTTILVDNVAPTAAITGAPASGHSPEGTAISLGSSVTDPSSADTNAGFTYVWSVTKNGNDYAKGTAAGFTFTPDDNGTYVVTLTATDRDGGTSPAAQTTILVDNVAPTVSITGAPARGHSPEGTDITLGSTVTDSSSADTHAGFTYAWSVTKNGVAVITWSGADLPPFAPDDNGTYVATLTATDKDGGVGTTSTTITVDNVAPTAGVFGPTDGVRGQARTFTLTATDPSPVDQAAGFTFAINWGDGSTQTVTGPSGTAVSHTYSASGAYTVKVTAKDKDGGTSAAASQTDTITAVALGTDPTDPSKTAPFAFQTQPPGSVQDVPALLSIQRGKLRHKGGGYRQTITVHNAGAPLQGPLYLVVGQLTRKVRLRHPAGRTRHAAPLGSPYVPVSLGNNMLGTGTTRTVVLRFGNSLGRKIRYSLRVLDGSGQP
jgi:hypothetical protein